VWFGSTTNPLVDLYNSGYKISTGCDVSEDVYMRCCCCCCCRDGISVPLDLSFDGGNDDDDDDDKLDDIFVFVYVCVLIYPSINCNRKGEKGILSVITIISSVD
jgi:hypothetical protein